MTYLILSGIYNSGPEHWQSIWMQENPRMVKLEHRSWTYPDREEWVSELDAIVDSINDKLVLVAHSLACLMVAHWANRSGGRVQGALLVSVPDPDGPTFPKDALNFNSLPQDPFEFKSMVVSSSNDPYGSQEHMRRMARAWGSEFIDVGELGHIDADSGLGGWPQGLEYLKRVER